MKSSLKLFSVWGIDIRLHITFPLILVWAAFQFGLMTGNVSGAIFGMVAISLLFVLVTLHELGHSFAALQYGVPVKQIILSPIGGVAQLVTMPDKPVQELVIAVAGPAVNFVAAVVLGVFIIPFNIDLSSVLGVMSGTGMASLEALFAYIFVSNIFLAVFNLIPAFPLDGGRILRSLLAMRLEYSRATSIAATVGRIFAVLLGFYGLFNGGIFLIFIAFFIYMAAGQEARYARHKSVLQRYTVQQVYSPSAYRLAPYTTLGQAMELMWRSGQTNFPVVVEDRLVGFVTRPLLERAIESHGKHGWVGDVMRRDLEPVLPASSLSDVQERLQTEELEALPVVANGYFMGLIDHRHIARLVKWIASGRKLPEMQSAST